MTVIVEARPRSGALITARQARELGRQLAAVPGRVTSPLARGPHRLLRDGALLVEGAEDLLDGLFGAGGAQAGPAADPGAPPGGLPRREPSQPELPSQLQHVLDELADGHGAPAALAAAGLDAERGLAALASLELAGRIRREPGGRYSVLL